MDKESFFISCPTGLEDLLEKELVAIGVTRLKRTRGGISIKERFDLAFEIILYSRIASRIYHKLKSFYVQKEKDLYRKACEIDWTNVFAIQDRFKIKTVITDHRSSKFKNSLYLSQLLKDSITDEFKKKFDGRRPSVDKENPNINFLLFIDPNESDNREKATVYFDLTGRPLSDRGYRSKNIGAPLRENLAAALVLSTNWNKEDTLIDPMCGTGTIIFEAALIKADIPPSYLRIEEYVNKTNPWSFLMAKKYKFNKDIEKIVKTKTAEAFEKITSGMKKLEKQQNPILGSDTHEKTLSHVRKSLRRSGLNNYIELEKADALKRTIPGEKGVYICNPPYGERLGDIEELKGFYHDLGEHLKNNYRGFDAYILTNSADLRKSISLRTKERIPFKNGNLDCRLLHYELY